MWVPEESWNLDVTTTSDKTNIQLSGYTSVISLFLQLRWIQVISEELRQTDRQTDKVTWLQRFWTSHLPPLFLPDGQLHAVAVKRQVKCCYGDVLGSVADAHGSVVTISQQRPGSLCNWSSRPSVAVQERLHREHIVKQILETQRRHTINEHTLRTTEAPSSSCPYRGTFYKAFICNYFRDVDYSQT